MNESEVIALLLFESPDTDVAESDRASRARCLVRKADGRFSLEAVGSRAEFDRAARTGCFRHGKPIHDPRTREIIGYEMEEVSSLAAASSG
jgi:hypothetical protein